MLSFAEEILDAQDSLTLNVISSLAIFPLKNPYYYHRINKMVINMVKLGNKEVSSIGLGTYGMGGKNTADYKNDVKEIEAIKYAITNGINLIDTAEYYGHGHSEELVGKAIKDFEREDLFIISKVWPVNLHYNDLINSAKESLKRLDTDYIDLYLIHWPNPKIPVKESLDAMGELLDNHLIGNIGVSNFDIANLTEAIDQIKPGKIIANEVEYNPGNYFIEDDLIPFCDKNNIKIIGYSPLNQGKISSKIAPVAKSLGMSSIQCTLGYLKKKSIPIPKASSISHINELVACMNSDLDENEYNKIKGAIRR
jgi:diketogulonate reductase-like aldo/keto reductase